MSNHFPIKIFQAALITGCLFFFGCENDPGKIASTNASRALVDEATGVESLLSQDGRPRAFLKAPFMLRYTADTSYTEFPKTLHVSFYDSSGKVESQLTARYGKYYETRNKVYLRDSVVVFNQKGDTLRAPDLWWDQNTRKFYTDKYIRLRQKDRRINGKGFEADQDLSHSMVFYPTGLLIVPDSVGVQ
jgi:LPS export ABC transporter protein LptC